MIWMFAATIIFVIAMIYVVQPLLAGDSGPGADQVGPRLSAERDRLVQDIRSLDEDLQFGRIEDEEHQDLRASLEMQLANVLSKQQSSDPS